MDDEKKKKYEDASITFNIAGKRFDTLVSTLTRFPDTLLGNPEKLFPYYHPDTDEFFFDRHRKAFNGILYFYQSNGVLERPEGVSEGLFMQEVLFFQLSQNPSQYQQEMDHKDEEHEQEPEEQTLHKNKTLRKLWILFEQPNSSRLASVIAVVSVIVIVVSIMVFCLESIPTIRPKELGTWDACMYCDAVCNIWFTVEYALRLVSAPDKLMFMKGTLNIIDLISILPFYVTVALGSAMDAKTARIDILKASRIIRVTKIFKLTRHSRGLCILSSTLASSRSELVMMSMFLITGVILFSTAMYYAESTTNENFRSIPHGFWWAIITMTTVGYGDMYPITVFGRCIGTLCAISGSLVIALPLPVFVSNFEERYKAEKDRKTRSNEVEKRLEQDQEKGVECTMKSMAAVSIAIGRGGNDPYFHQTIACPSHEGPT